MSIQTFSQILESRTGEANSSFLVTEDWTQGRTIFGGIIAGLAHESMRRNVPKERPLRGLQLTFASPNSPGTIVFENEIIREGKSVTTVLSRVSPGGSTTALVTGIYGASRTSVISAPPIVGTPQSTADQLSDLVVPPDFAPNHFQHFAVRYSGGGFPYSGTKERNVSAYVRFVPGEFSHFALCHLIALLDVLPTPALSMVEGYAPASTLSWTIELLDASTNFSPEQWWWLSSTVDAASDGYSCYTLYLVNPDQRVAAISRQITTIFG